MEHLKAAVEAAIPLISVTTSDLVHAVPVIQHVLGKTIVPLKGWNVDSLVGKQQVYYTIPTEDISDKFLAVYYESLIKAEKTIIVINPVKTGNLFFHAGELPVPKKMMSELVNEIADSPKAAEEILLRLGGCTLKEAAELIRLTMVNTGALTAQGLAHTRRELFRGGKGIYPIDTVQPIYIPSEELVEWLLLEKDYFLHGSNPSMRPRGILFDGPPGVGKSSAAKWIAEEMGVPFYLMSVSGAQEKWVGMSEANFDQALEMAEREAPCVVLFDEVEKIFATNTSDTSSSMLADLLWWLQEHKSRVLTVMTTNDRKKIPPELYREGRIDKVIEVQLADKTVCKSIVYGTVKSLGIEEKVADEIWKSMLKSHLGTTSFTYPHAYMVEKTKHALKALKLGL